MSTQEIVNKRWNLCNVLRDDPFWLERERRYQLELPRTKATPQKGPTGRG